MRSRRIIMIYPPGIPVVIPGEVISEEIINDLNDYLKKGSTILSESELDLLKLRFRKHSFGGRLNEKKSIYHFKVAIANTKKVR